MTNDELVAQLNAQADSLKQSVEKLRQEPKLLDDWLVARVTRAVVKLDEPIATIALSMSIAETTQRLRNR